MAKTLDQIWKDYRDGAYNSKVEVPDKLPENYVFSDDITIRQNREKLAQAEEARFRAIEEKKLDVDRLHGRFEKDVKDWIFDQFIQDSAEFKDSVTELVYYRAWEQWHHNMDTFFDNITWLVDFAKQLYASGLSDSGNLS